MEDLLPDEVADLNIEYFFQGFSDFEILLSMALLE